MAELASNALQVRVNIPNHLSQVLQVQRLLFVTRVGKVRTDKGLGLPYFQYLLGTHFVRLVNLVVRNQK